MRLYSVTNFPISSFRPQLIFSFCPNSFTSLNFDTIILIASYAQDSASRWNIYNQKLDSGARLAMEYAKKYNIPRAVMYNKDIDTNNPMFDLNRQLIAEQKDTTILTPKNLEKIINTIKEKKSNNNDFQPNLFTQ
jgi:DNA processing protein